MSDLLEKTDVQTTDAGDHDRFTHYFAKSDLEKAWLDGAEIEALCGKRDTQTRDFTKYPVCPECTKAWEQKIDA